MKSVSKAGDLTTAPQPGRPTFAALGSGAILALVAVLVVLVPATATAATPQVEAAAAPSYIQSIGAGWKFVKANLAGGQNQALQATSENVGPWEEFDIIRRGENGEVAFYSRAANRYVQANLSGGQNATLQANAFSIGPWEQFVLRDSPRDQAIWSVGAQRWVTANLAGGNGRLQATATEIGPWEEFALG